MSEPSAPVPGGGRRRLLDAPVGVLAALTVALIVVRLAGPGDSGGYGHGGGQSAPSTAGAAGDTTVAGSPRHELGDGSPRHEPGVAAAAGRRLVATLERAWGSRERDAFTGAAADTPAARRSARATWAALGRLGVEDLELRWLARRVPPPSAPVHAVAAAVEVSWTQSGWEAAATTQLDVVLTVDDPTAGRAVGSLVELAAADDEPFPLWAGAPLRIARTPAGATVVSLAGPPTRHVRQLVDAADREVAGLLGPSTSPLVVVAPDTSAQFSDLLGDGRDHSRIAAVTTTVDGSVRGDALVQVLLNPAVFGELRPAAAAVVLAHEATHVATGASGTGMPPWVAEGFADFVALRDADVPLRVAAGRALAAVRRTGAPTRLPTAADFATDAPGLGRAYELAWLAFRVLEVQAGSAATVAFHRAVVAGRPVDAALRDTAGLDGRELTRAWRHELVRLASVRR